MKTIKNDQRLRGAAVSANAEELQHGTKAYAKPKVTRFGTFRGLTQLGPSSGSDVATVFGLSPTCNNNTGDPTFSCGGRS